MTCALLPAGVLALVPVAAHAGPVFFLDKNLQPGGSKYMWTAQLDVDIPLGR